jgi:outer membrane protein assembly factor BamB
MPKQDDYYGDSYATPVIYKDQVIVYTSQDVAGYNLKTGQQIWKYVIDIADAVCTPALGKDIIYTVSYSTYGNPDMRAQFPDFLGFVAVYDVNKDFMIDKKEIKDVQFMVYPEKPEVTAKVSMIDVFGMWDKNNNELIDSTEWKMMNEYLESFYVKQGIKAIKLGGQGDVSLNNFLWGNSEQASHIPSPLYYNNYVYVIRDGGIISCFHSESGILLYHEKLGATGAYFSSPIAANGRIYIASRNGIVTVIEAGDHLNILAQNNLGDIITATPAVVDNKLYIRTAKSLYAFGE